MVQIAKDSPTAFLQDELLDEFNWLISQLSNKNEIDLFLKEFFSKTERVMLSKRLAIALLLSNGYSYRDIRKILKVSFPTVRTVQFWLDYGRGGYKQAVKKILVRPQTQKIIERIDKILDRL